MVFVEYDIEMARYIYSMHLLYFMIFIFSTLIHDPCICAFVLLCQHEIAASFALGAI